MKEKERERGNELLMYYYFRFRDIKEWWVLFYIIKFDDLKVLNKFIKSYKL